jgi:hypothetical protein
MIALVLGEPEAHCYRLIIWDKLAFDVVGEEHASFRASIK